MIFVCILLVIFVILIMPLKLKIKTIYENNEFQVYVFDKRVHFKKNQDSTNKNNKKNITELIKANGISRLRKLINIKYKPKLDLNLEVHYGFEDAAFTGVLYGVIQNTDSILYQFFSSFFKIQGYKFNVIPNFNKAVLNFRINSIFSFNLVKIIYILIRIYI